MIIKQKKKTYSIRQLLGIDNSTSLFAKLILLTSKSWKAANSSKHIMANLSMSFV